MARFRSKHPPWRCCTHPDDVVLPLTMFYPPWQCCTLPDDVLPSLTMFYPPWRCCTHPDDVLPSLTMLYPPWQFCTHPDDVVSRHIHLLQPRHGRLERVPRDRLSRAALTDDHDRMTRVLGLVELNDFRHDVGSRLKLRLVQHELDGFAKLN